MPRPNPAPDLAGPVPILNGSDGFLAYCTLCNEPATPWTFSHGRRRATVQAALADRMLHLAARHGDLSP